MPVPDLDGAVAAVDVAATIVTAATRRLAGEGSIDDDQVVAYDVAHAAAAVETARAAVDYGGHGDAEAGLACAFVADAVHDLLAKVAGRDDAWDVKPDAFDPIMPFVTAHRDPAFLAGLADDDGARHLDADFELVQETFRRFADDKVRPVAEHVHRTNADIPE